MQLKRIGGALVEHLHHGDAQIATERGVPFKWPLPESPAGLMLDGTQRFRAHDAEACRAVQDALQAKLEEATAALQASQDDAAAAERCATLLAACEAAVQDLKDAEAREAAPATPGEAA